MPLVRMVERDEVPPDTQQTFDAARSPSSSADAGWAAFVSPASRTLRRRAWRAFVEDAVEPGTVVYTDGYGGYASLGASSLHSRPPDARHRGQG